MFITSLRPIVMCLFTSAAFASWQSPDDPPSISWNSIGERMEFEAKEHDFCGSVLVVRNGEIAFQKSYGMANREKSIANNNDTIYAVGSTPIDFTKASILLLVDRGKVALEDPITKYFQNVPDDKQSITVQHLMSGRSGLLDFHDVPGDENPDHTWIDRDEAVKRIFAQKLLFEPGSKRQHSHSAWGLLAAIVEIASGKSYPEFTRENIYEPLGMKDTGFFGESYPESRVAVGYGFRKSSDPNSPPHWGQTSWLVMGSGGQVSTLGDMFRFVTGTQAGELHSAEITERFYKGGGTYANGDMFGFEFIYSDGPDSMVFLISNAIDSREQRKKFDQLGRELISLVRSESGPKFSLGIAMQINADAVMIDRITPGSAAERDGLQNGDKIISAGGQPLGEEPMSILGPYLQSGKAIEFEIQRDGRTRKITVKPNPR